MTDSSSRRTPPPIPPPRGAPGHAGARIMGQFGEELAERLTKDHLGKNPGVLAKAILENVAKYPELAVKMAGFSFGEVGREVIFRALQGLGINTENDLVRSLADTPDNVFRGIVEAYAETARKGVPPASATPTAGTPVSTNGKVAVSSEVDDFAHKTSPDGTAVLCNTFFKAEQAWERKRSQGSGAPSGDQQQGGRGRGRGNQQQNQPQSGKFPMKLFSIEQAKQMGLDECPICKPFTAAGLAAQEASVISASAAADAAKPKPLPGWEADIGVIGRWLAIVFAASLSNADFGNEMKTVPAKIWIQHAFAVIRKYAKKVGKTVDSDITSIELLNLDLPDKLEPEDVEATIMQIKVHGAYEEDFETKAKSVLDFFSTQKKKAEDEKKKTEADANIKAANRRVKNAKKNLTDIEDKRAALNAADADLEAAKKSGDQKRMTDAGKAYAAAKAAFKTVEGLEDAFQDELEEAEKEQAAADKAKVTLDPPPPPKSPWPSRIGIGLAIYLVAMVAAGLYQFVLR